MELQQRIEGTNLRVDQRIRSYGITDLDEALDLLLATYAGMDVIAETTRALFRRALQRSNTQRAAANMLGVSPRMLTYHKQRILALQTR